MRQSHDLWHVVTGYGPDVGGEIALQAFTWGVTRMPSARMIAVLGSLRHARHDIGIIRRAIAAARRGRRARFLPTVRWEDHFERPLSDVQRELLAA
jgi:ubiquinone biosynthesis protein COQ4